MEWQYDDMGSLKPLTLTIAIDFVSLLSKFLAELAVNKVNLV